MADGLEHLADLLRAPFAQLDFEPAVAFVVAFAGGVHPLDVARQRAFAVDGDAAAQFVDQPFLGDAAHFHAVRFHRAVRRMRDLERELAVVRQQHQSLGMEVETADRIDALADSAHEIDDGAAALRVLDRRHHFFRFVQEDVAMRLGFA